MKIVELAVLSGARFHTYVPFSVIAGREEFSGYDHFTGYVISSDQLSQFAELVIAAHTAGLLIQK